MSLTSYRAAPPRGRWCIGFGLGSWSCCGEAGCGLGRPGSDLLSHALRRSTIGAEGFHDRVRDGIGWFTPRHCHQVIEARRCLGVLWGCLSFRLFVLVSRLKAGGPGPGWCLAAVRGGAGFGLAAVIKPIERLVGLSFTHCCASTRPLSTSWSTTALGETWF